MMNSNEKIINEAIKNKDVRFLCKYYFGDDISPLQEVMIRIIAFKEHNRFAVSAMTRWGKSFCISRGVALNFLMNTNQRCYFLGPKQEQAAILRDEMTYVILNCKELLNEADLEMKGTDKIRKEASKTRMTFTKPNNEYRVFSAEGDANRLMGHGIGPGGGYVIKDEAVLIPDTANAKIMRMAGDNPENTMIIEAFNPWNRDNKVHEHVNDPNWEYMHVGWEDAVKDGRVDREFVEEQRRDLTELEFTVLYESNFPGESEDQLIPYWAIQKAIRPIPKLPVADECRFGIDVAEMGKDFTVVAAGTKHAGLYVLDQMKWWGKKEVMETVGNIVLLENDRNKVDLIRPDATGMGTGVAGRLEELKKDGKIQARIERFVSAKSPRTKKLKEEYLNMKAQAFFHMRKVFVNGNIIIPPEIAKGCPQLISELGKMKWKPNSSAKKQILDPGEAKDDTSVKKSPDFADALCYMVFDDEVRGVIKMLDMSKRK